MLIIEKIDYIVLLKDREKELVSISWNIKFVSVKIQLI